MILDVKKDNKFFRKKSRFQRGASGKTLDSKRLISCQIKEKETSGFVFSKIKRYSISRTCSFFFAERTETITGTIIYLNRRNILKKNGLSISLLRNHPKPSFCTPFEYFLPSSVA